MTNPGATPPGRRLPWPSGAADPSGFDDILRLARILCPARGHAVIVGEQVHAAPEQGDQAIPALRGIAVAVRAAGEAQTLPGRGAGVPVVVDGSIVGVLCMFDPGMFDPVPGGAILEPVMAHLADLAGLAAERIGHQQLACENAQLHAVRSLREQLMAAAAEAPDVTAALSAAANVFMSATGAISSYVFRLANDGHHVLVLDGARHDALGTTHYLDSLRAIEITVANSPTGAALASGRQIRVPDLTDPAVVDQPIARIGRRFNLTSVIVTPLSLGSQAFCFSVGFTARPDDFDALGDLVLGATLALRPLLRRLHDDEMMQLYRRALDASPDVAIITEAEPVALPGPRIVYVNPAFTRETGYSAAEAIGQTPRMLQGAGTTAAARSTIHKALGAWQPVRQELLNYRKDGTAFWLELNIAPVADSSGWYTHWVCVQRNTTERRAAEARHIEDAREIELLIAAMPGTLQRMRPDRRGRWRIIYSAPSMVSLSGFTPEELVANVNFDYVDEADRMLMQDRLNHALDQGQATGEIRLRRRDGEVRILQARMRANPRSDRVREVIVIWTDVTSEREMAAQGALTGRLASLGEMASGIAHELNQPLTAIVLLTDTLAALMQSGYADTAGLLDRLGRIGDQALRAGKIIDNLRDFTRSHARENGTASLADAVERTKGLVGALMATDGIHIASDLPADLPMVHGEVTRIEQVLVNLFSNARDVLLQQHQHPRVVRLRGRHDADRVQLIVSDTGGGISPDYLARLFDPFFTTKGPDHGTGLGLSICRTAMRQMGGTISARNQAEGAEFTLTFLRAEAAASGAPRDRGDDAEHRAAAPQDRAN